MVALLLLWQQAAIAQQTIRGKVLAVSGEPIPNASIFIPNTSMGTTSKADGTFVLDRFPPGTFKMAVSCIGYELAIVPVANDREKEWVIRLQRKDNSLNEVIVRNYVQNGWKKWGEIFQAAFIGTSAFAPDCRIVNTDVLHFVYNEHSSVLQVFADEPLVIENRALGYHISTELVDFSYNITTNDVDYQIYSYFLPLAGSEREIGTWTKNRKTAYRLSSLAFFRAVYQGAWEKKYTVLRLVKENGKEKIRIQALYQQRIEQLSLQLGQTLNMSDRSDRKLLDKTFPRDSVTYYTKVLQQQDNVVQLKKSPLSFADIATRIDSNTARLDFDQYLLVVNRQMKEPTEYLQYRRQVLSTDKAYTMQASQLLVPEYPETELFLTKGLPIDIHPSGYFNNVDLYFNGFWGWWEKLATRLPYEYEE